MDEKTPGIISSVMVTDQMVSPVKTSSNLRTEKTNELGLPYFQLKANTLIDEFTNVVMERLLDDNQLFGDTLVIDKAVLDNDKMMDAIREKARKQGRPLVVRISDQGYTLTKEDYAKLSFAPHIAVDACEEDLRMENNILIQNGVFKLGVQHDAQPVLERRKSFDELVSRNVFHVNHPLTEEEFRYLADCINKTDNVSIELDYFNPDYYEEFLRKLQDYNVKTDINIQLIGYLLEDKLDTFERLEAFPYEIDVVYSTCHDMIDLYTIEPYTENRMYYSQVEGGGKTSLGNYLNVLEELTNFEAIAKTGNYSPLETAILAKIKIDSDYIYDPDYLNPDTDFWDNVNLSQMIHHEENGKKRAICVGFSTLYSAYCRRCGIPMFRYSTRGHMRSIGRIQDEKYGIDTIGTSDITWDLPDQNGSTYSYKYFMGSPRDFRHHQNKYGSHEFLTIADVFALPYEDFLNLLIDAKDPVESFYSQINYNPMGYAARLLELMDVVPETQTLDLYSTIYGLCEKGCFEGIPEETLITAITNVLHSLHWSDEAIDNYIQEVRDNQKLRPYLLGNSPAVGTTDGLHNIPVNVVTPENVQSYRDALMQNPNRPTFIRQPVTSGNTNQPENKQPIPQPEIDNLDYVHQVIQYCAANNISVYSYYHNIGNMYHGDAYSQVPAFENNNPYIEDSERALIRDSKEERIIHYFANAMAKVIRLNLSQEESKQFERLFTKEDENYVNEVMDEMNDKIKEKKELEKGNTKDNTPTPSQQEETNLDDYSEELIPGTNIHKPRERGVYESDEEYVDFLREFYQKHFPNADYIQEVLKYCQENQINLYNYYYAVGNSIRSRHLENLPAFEINNPFLSKEDHEILQSAEDEMILTHFSNAMMRNIGLNLSDFKRDELQQMFSDEAENYTMAVEEQYQK